MLQGKAGPEAIAASRSIFLLAAVTSRVLARLGWKTTMILGILGHAARFAVFAFMPQNQAIIIAVQVLHGICYAFFFATLYIFIDTAFPKDIRSSAQSLFNLLVLGLGDLAAKWFFIPLQGSLTQDGVTNYRQLFLVPAALAIGAASLFHNPLMSTGTKTGEGSVTRNATPQASASGSTEPHITTEPAAATRVTAGSSEVMPSSETGGGRMPLKSQQARAINGRACVKWRGQEPN